MLMHEVPRRRNHTSEAPQQSADVDFRAADLAELNRMIGEASVPAAEEEPTPLQVEVAQEERVRRGLKRVAGISASLVGSQALTSVLGLVFWALAARTFSTSAVGVAGAAVSMMMLLGSLGSLGLGTLLISKLPHTDQGQRRQLIRTCLVAAGAAGFLLALVVPVLAIHVFGAENFRPIAGSLPTLLGLAAGTGLMSVVLVLDQAVLTIGFGALQLERNVTASVIKIVALLGLSQLIPAGAPDGQAVLGLSTGMTIFLSWTIGNLLSLPVVALRTRGGRSQQTTTQLIRPSLMRGLGRSALSHHALNTTLQAALQILPILVTLMVSSRENAFFNSALMVCGFVFALPYSISIGLFASAGGRESDVLARMRLTIPFSLGVSITAYLFLFPLAGTVLNIFGASYAEEGVEVLRLLALAGIPFVIKDHYVALRRVQGRTTSAVSVLSGFLVLELAGAVVGAGLNGTVGLCLGWLIVLFAEALILTVPLWRSWRAMHSQTHSAHPTAELIEDLAGQRADDPLDLTEVTASASSAGVASPLLTGSMTEVADLLSDLKSPEQLVEEPPALFDKPVPEKATRLAAIGKLNLFAPLLLVMSLGLVLMAVAAAGSRQDGPTGLNQALWVLGQIVIFLPVVLRMALNNTGNAERIGLAVSVGIIFQLSRRVLDPLHFAYFDELLHATTLRQLDETGHLYALNPLLPVSGFYPGLEVATDAISRLTGLSVLNSATLLLVFARVIIMLAIIGLIRAVSGSTKAASLAAVLYLCNPQFLFFNSQYSYQTLALPLAVFTVYAFMVRRRGSRTALLIPLVLTAAVTSIHHLTAMLLIAAFATWLGFELMCGGTRPSSRAHTRRTRSTVGRIVFGRDLPVAEPGVDLDPVARRMRHHRDVIGLLLMTLIGSGMTVMATLIPGNPVGGYLKAIFVNFGTGASGLAAGDSAKPIFSDRAGAGPAPWEQVLLVTSVLIALLSMLAALIYARDSLARRHAFGLVLAVLALLYPIVPGGHLTTATAEVGDRAAGFAYLGLAAAVGWWLSRRQIAWRGATVVAILATVAFIGGAILGAGPTARQLPGPYLISADARSIDADNLAAAQFLAIALPPDSRIFADRIGGLLAAADGNQFTVRHLSTGIDASRLLLDPNFTQADIDLIKKAGLQFLVVDTRISEGLPHLDVYIETGEFEGRTRTEPVSPVALEKFASVPGVDRIYDNGSVMVYDLRGLTNGN